MNEFDYRHRAEKANKTDIVFSVSCYLSAAVLYFSSIFVPGIKYVPVLQFGALVCLVAGIYINQRFSWCVYTYGVMPKENINSGETIGTYFVVYRTVGKRQSCLCKTDMSGLLRLVRCTHKDAHKEIVKEYTSPNIYNFCATMCPAVYYRAVFEADGGIAIISFEPDKALLGIISGFANEKDGKEE